MQLVLICASSTFFVFFFNDTATTEIYTLSLHDALPISPGTWRRYFARPTLRDTRSTSRRLECASAAACVAPRAAPRLDRKSTRLNSSHGYISYAVFCLKKILP